DRPVDDRQRAQAEEVELDQADGLDIVLVELRDDDVVAAFAVERRKIRQRLRRDYDAAGMLAGVARQALEFARQIEQRLDILLGVVARDQVAGGQLRLFGALDRI